MTQTAEKSDVRLEKEILEHEAFLEFSLAVNAADDLSKIYQIIMRTCMGQKGITVTSLCSIEDTASGVFRISAIKGGDTGLVGAKMALPDPVVSDFVGKKTVIVPDLLSACKLSSETCRLINAMESVLMVPITFHRKVIGILTCGPRIFNDSYTEDDIDFLNRIANHAGAAIEHLVTMKALEGSHIQLEKQYFELEAVDEISRSMSATLNLQEVCHTLLLTIVGHLTAISGSFYIQSKETPSQFKRIAQIGGGGQNIPEFICLSPETKTILKTQTVLGNTSSAAQKIAPLLEKQGAAICVPVGQTKELLGLCFFGEKATELPYQRRELEFAALLVSQAIAPIRNSMFSQLILDRNQELQMAYESLTREVAERRSAEAAIVRNEQRLRTILETANEGFIEEDAQGRITDVNPELCTILGRSREELVGRNITKFIRHTENDKLSRQLEQRRKGQRSAYELTFIHRDGTPVDCLIKASPVAHKTETGREFSGAFAMVTDITQRKRNEEDLREYARIVSSSSDMMALINRKREFRKVNEAFKKGFDKIRSRVQGARLCDVFDPEALAEMDKRLYRCFQGEIVHFQCWVRLPSGRRHFMDIMLSPYWENSPADDISGGIIIMRDMTYMKSLEEQLLMSQKLEAVGTLSSGIAHDFNNILSGIFVYTQMALTRIPENRIAQEHLNEVLAAGRRAADLVQQILAFSRQTTRDRSPIVMAPLIKEALKMIRALLPATIEIRQNQITENIKCVADATQIHQILMNLCTNAAHAMAEEGGTLTVGLAPVEINAQAAESLDIQLRPGWYAELTVKDTGEGISPEIKERIFEPFFTTKEPGRGSGMGLAVTHGIVKNHEGAIAVSSSPGRGTLFQIYFPIYEGEFSSEERFDDLTIPTGNEHILMVDDEQGLAQMMEKLLETMGYSVTAVADSREALKHFQAHPDQYDLVIADQIMPNMTGTKLTRELLRIREDIPIILTSGIFDNDGEHLKDNAGIRGFLKKPWDQKEIGRLIRNVLDNSNALNPAKGD